MEVPLNDCEDCQKLQIKDASLCANISVIQRTLPANSQNSRRFRARSCKASRPAEKIIIDLTEDDNNDSGILCSENLNNDKIVHTDDNSNKSGVRPNAVHTDDNCDKDGVRSNAVSKKVKETPLQVPRVDVQELERGSDMHEFLLCLGSNVLKDITCNSGWGLVDTDHKVTALITGKSDSPAVRHERKSQCVSSWGIVNNRTKGATTSDTSGLLSNRLTKDSFNDDGWGMPNDDPLLSNKPTKDPSADDGWGMPNEDAFDAVAQENVVSNQNSSRSTNELERRATFSGIPSKDTSHDDGWGMVNEDKWKTTAQENSTSIQTLWSGARDIENTDMSKDKQRNWFDCMGSGIKGRNGQVRSISDTNGYKIKEDRRCSGKYAPSGSNLVPLGKRKIMAGEPDREDPCESGWEVVDNETDNTDTCKWADKGHKLTDTVKESGDLGDGKLDDGWSMPSRDLCNATAQESSGDDGWGITSKDVHNATAQVELGEKAPSEDGWGMSSKDQCSKDSCNETPWSAVNEIESRGILSQGSVVPTADKVTTTGNPLDCVRSERREQSRRISSMNDSVEDDENADRRRSGKYALSGANLEPLGKRKMTNRLVMKDPCTGGWTSTNEETGCTDASKVSDKRNKITNLTMKSPSRVGRPETDLACDDGWGRMNEDNESSCDFWGCRLETDSQSGRVCGNTTEDQCKFTTQENMSLIHTPLSAANDFENRDEALYIPSEGFEMSDLNPVNVTQYPSDCVNLERKGQNVRLSMNATYEDDIKRKYPENDNDGKRHSGRYEPSGSNRRRYRFLWDQSMCPTEHLEVHNAVKTLANSMGKILHQSGYNVGDKLSPEDQREVIDNALSYHPDKENKIGCGVDYIMIDTHSDHQSARCFFIVRNDGSRSDFSYWKCVKGFVQDRYPDLVNEVFEHLQLL